MAMGCVWTTYGLCVCCEGLVSCMWWPWLPWGACRLPMGCVCVVREVRATCSGHGGHGVRVDYLWAMCVRNGCGLVEFGGCMETFFGATPCGMATSSCFLFHFDANFRKNKNKNKNLHERCRKLHHFRV